MVAGVLRFSTDGARRPSLMMDAWPPGVFEMETWNLRSPDGLCPERHGDADSWVQIHRLAFLDPPAPVKQD